MNEPSTPTGGHGHFAAEAAAVRQAADALDAFCASERLPRQTTWQLQVALDEIVTNIVTHATRGAGSPGFDVWFRRDGEYVEIVVADDGPAFDPLARSGADVTLPLDRRQPGGLGIMLVRSLMDEVHYERTTRNILTIRKRITPGGGGAADEAGAR